MLASEHHTETSGPARSSLVHLHALTPLPREAHLFPLPNLGEGVGGEGHCPYLAAALAPRRASSPARSSARVPEPRRVSHSSRGTAHITSSSLPSGSCAYRLKLTPWSDSPTRAPLFNSASRARARSWIVSTSQAAWYIPTRGPAGSGAAPSPTANTARSWSLSLPLARMNAPRSLADFTLKSRTSR